MADDLDIQIIKYNEKCIVLRGEDTKTYKENIKQINGKYSDRLKGGPGWIFPSSRRAEVEKALAGFVSGEPIKPRSYRNQQSSGPPSNIGKRLTSLEEKMNEMMLMLQILVERKSGGDEDGDTEDEGDDEAEYVYEYDEGDEGESSEDDEPLKAKKAQKTRRKRLLG